MNLDCRKKSDKMVCIGDCRDKKDKMICIYRYWKRLKIVWDWLIENGLQAHGNLPVNDQLSINP